MRGIGVHLALLALAVVTALSMWTRDKKAAGAVSADVAVWTGRADDVQRVSFESKGKKVTLEAKADAAGRYFIGTALVPAPPASDAGVTPAPKTVTFVSVGEAQKVAEGVAPFKAIRDVGRVEGDRADEFGLKEPAGTLVVDLAGKQHKLLVGGTTPGSNDRYVRVEESGEVYAANGDFLRSLESGDASLTERELHGFKDPDLEDVRVLARGKNRQILRRGPESKRIWADPSDPEKADETATNWLTKIERLRPTEYVVEVGTPPETVVRPQYAVKGATGVFLELGKHAGGTGSSPPAGKAEYFVRTERTRLWAKVPPTIAEQVEQDLGSVLK